MVDNRPSIDRRAWSICATQQLKLSGTENLKLMIQRASFWWKLFYDYNDAFLGKRDDNNSRL